MGNNIAKFMDYIILHLKFQCHPSYIVLLMVTKSATFVRHLSSHLNLNTSLIFTAQISRGGLPSDACLDADTPPPPTLRHSQLAGGMHPPGMQSCLSIN